MPKGKIEAFCMALIETNNRLSPSLQTIADTLNRSFTSRVPLSQEENISLVNSLNAVISITRSNQVQLQSMLEEAYEKGV